MVREIHPHFQYFLDFKEQQLIELYSDLRDYMLSLYPDSVELLYHTHALTSVYALSEKLSDAYCMLPIYTNHVNLGFNKGTLLEDPRQLLKGTGKLIRHIPVEKPSDYRNEKVAAIIKSAINLAIADQVKESEKKGITISKIKEPK